METALDRNLQMGCQVKRQRTEKLACREMFRLYNRQLNDQVTWLSKLLSHNVETSLFYPCYLKC